jgi:hypothetical protein
MSMYTTLLGSTLDERDQSDSSASIGELFAQLLRCRIRLADSGILSPRHAKTLGDVTGQLEYDFYLISLSRSLGVEFAIEQFDDGERHRLEQALIDRGVPLDDLDERTAR